jgi:hypothetical protein
MALAAAVLDESLGVFDPMNPFVFRDSEKRTDFQSQDLDGRATGRFELGKFNNRNAFAPYRLKVRV